MEQRVNLYLVMVYMGSDSSVCNVYFIILLIGLLLWFIGCLSRKYIEFIDLYLYVETLFFISMGI